MYSDTNLIYIFTVLEAIEKINIYTQEFNNDETFYHANNQSIRIRFLSSFRIFKIKDEYDGAGLTS